MHDLERMSPSNPPSLLQLRRLARIGLGSARERQIMRRTESGDKYSRDVLESAIEVGDELAFVRHTTSMRIGRSALAGGDVWQLKLYDAQRFLDRDVASATMRYTFEWDSHQVLQARREASAVYPYADLSAEESIARSLEHFYIDEHDAALLAAEESFAEVTYGDCEQLIGDMSRYYASLPKISR